MSARKPRSAAQKAAHARNWRIFKLRGIWHQLGPLSPDRRGQVQSLLDAELVALGAEPEGDRHDRIMAEIEAAFPQDTPPSNCD